MTRLENPAVAGHSKSAMHRPTRALIGALVAMAFIHGHAAELRVADFADLTLEQLANIEVTSVSRRSARRDTDVTSIFASCSRERSARSATGRPAA